MPQILLSFLRQLIFLRPWAKLKSLAKEQPKKLFLVRPYFAMQTWLMVAIPHSTLPWPWAQRLNHPLAWCTPLGTRLYRLVNHHRRSAWRLLNALRGKPIAIGARLQQACAATTMPASQELV